MATRPPSARAQRAAEPAENTLPVRKRQGVSGVVRALVAHARTTRLRLVHDQFERETPTYQGSVEAWPLMMSSLESLLETGKALPSPTTGESQ